MIDDDLKQQLYVSNFEHWKQQCNRQYYSDREPEVQTIKHGIILPVRYKPGVLACKGGVCDQNFNFIAGHSIAAPGKLNAWSSIDEGYTVDQSELEHSDEDVIWGGAMVCHFGHFLTDSLVRMWYPVEHPDDQRKIIFCRVISWRPAPWMDQFYDLLGINKERIVLLTKPTQFKSVTIPDQSWRPHHSYTDKMMTPYRKISAAVEPRPNTKKIFLTRSRDLKSPTYLANADYFDEFYQRKGYEVIAPETLSIVEQIALVKGADEIVTHMGTLAHWALMCRPGVRWTMLLRVPTFIHRQHIINLATQIDWRIVDTSMNFLHAEQGGGVCLIGQNEHWQRFVHDHYQTLLEQDDRLPSHAIHDYIQHWVERISKPEQLNTRVKTVKALYSRLSMLETHSRLGRPVLCYEVHQARKAWLPQNVENEVGGVLNQKLDIQALKIYFSEPYVDVSYSVYYPDVGWSKSVVNGATAGTTGKSKAILGVSISLDGKTAFDIRYRVHDFNGKWSDWSSNGAKLISKIKLDGIEINLIPNGGTFDE